MTEFSDWGNFQDSIPKHNPLIISLVGLIWFEYNMYIHASYRRTPKKFGNNFLSLDIFLYQKLLLQPFKPKLSSPSWSRSKQLLKSVDTIRDSATDASNHSIQNKKLIT